jgi:hypothetical protein
MSAQFLNYLAAELKADKNAACRRAIQRILAMVKKTMKLGSTVPKLKPNMPLATAGNLPEIEDRCGQRASDTLTNLPDISQRQYCEDRVLCLPVEAEFGRIS